MTAPVLSILIATTVDRREMFEKLFAEFLKQIEPIKVRDEHMVEIRYLEDNKELSIGAKRQKLLEIAKGEWIVFFDSDDWPAPNYVQLIYEAITTNKGIDCVGMNVAMTTNGENPQRCCHRLLYKEWADNIDGWDFVRNITHFNPVKKTIALQVGFPDLRFGEDKWYSDRVTALCTKEAYIEQALFHYRYTNHMNSKEKYGIK